MRTKGHTQLHLYGGELARSIGWRLETQTRYQDKKTFESPPWIMDGPLLPRDGSGTMSLAGAAPPPPGAGAACVVGGVPDPGPAAKRQRRFYELMKCNSSTALTLQGLSNTSLLGRKMYPENSRFPPLPRLNLHILSNFSSFPIFLLSPLTHRMRKTLYASVTSA